MRSPLKIYPSMSKSVVSVGAVIVLISLLLWIFSANLIAWGVEQIGTSVLDQTVVLEEGKIDFFPLKVTLNNLQIQESKQLELGTIQVKNTVFLLEEVGLFGSPWVIDGLRMQGISFKADKLIAKEDSFSIGQLTPHLDYSKFLHNAMQNAIHQADRLQNEMESTEREWQQTLKQEGDTPLNRVETIKKFKKQIAWLKNSPSRESNRLASDFVPQLATNVRLSQPIFKPTLIAWLKKVVTLYTLNLDSVLLKKGQLFFELPSGKFEATFHNQKAGKKSETGYYLKLVSQTENPKHSLRVQFQPNPRQKEGENRYDLTVKLRGWPLHHLWTDLPLDQGYMDMKGWLKLGVKGVQGALEMGFFSVKPPFQTLSEFKVFAALAGSLDAPSVTLSSTMDPTVLRVARIHHHKEKKFKLKKFSSEMKNQLRETLLKLSAHLKRLEVLN